MSSLVLEVLLRAWRGGFFLVPLAVLALDLALGGLAWDLSMGGRARAVMDLSLALVWLAGGGLGLALGLRHPGAELRQGAAAQLLAGPLSATRFAAGRVLGAVLTSTLLVAALVALSAARTSLVASPSLALLGVFGLALAVEVAVVTAMASLLGSLARPPLAAAAVVGMWISGHLLGAHGVLAAQRGGGVALIHGVLVWLVPDLGALNVHPLVVQGEELLLADLGLACAHGVAWVIGLGALTALVVSGRDLA